MNKKVLILANISILTILLSGCPSRAVHEKVYQQQHKQEVLKRSDKQFKDMENQMNQ